MAVRPEFDVTLAYNPDAGPRCRWPHRGHRLTRCWSRARSTAARSSLGQGGVVRLDGSMDPVGPRVLFVALGSESAGATGQLARGAVDAARAAGSTRHAAAFRPAATSPASRPPGAPTLASTRAAAACVMFEVDRAADIRQLLRFAKRHGVKIGHRRRRRGLERGGRHRRGEGAGIRRPARQPARGLRRDRRAHGQRRAAAPGRRHRGHRAGRREPHAQRAQDAPARGQRGRQGFAVGRRPRRAEPRAGRGCSASGSWARSPSASAPTWCSGRGDPLDVANVAQQVWLDGRPITMRSRQTDLRDRYLAPKGPLPRAYDVPDRRR